MKYRHAVIAGLLIAVPRAVLADEPTKQQCVDANTSAQTLRASGHFAQAMTALDVCASPSCPQIVRDDCTQRIDEIQRAQPSIVFSARSGAGQDLVDVTVTVDGKPLATKLDGRPLPLDPGDHTFVFQMSGEDPVTQHFVLSESERGRHETITIGKAPPAPQRRSSPDTALPAKDDPGAGNGQRILGLGAAGVGLAGIAVGAIFGLSASSSWSSAQNECASSASCDRSAADGDRSSALTKATVSTVAFIAGGAFVVGGAVLYFTAPKARSSVTVGVAPAPGGAFLRGTF